MSEKVINEAIQAIYGENWEHLDFMENMAGVECDCNIHNLLNGLATYIGLDTERVSE